LIEWLSRADELLGRLDVHKKTLASLRANSLPYGQTEARTDQEDHPKWEELQEALVSKPLVEEQLALLEIEGTDADEYFREQSKSYSWADPIALKQSLVELESQIDTLTKVVSERRTWEFGNMEFQWQHDMVAGLVSRLETLSDKKKGIREKVQARLTFASTIEKRSITDHRQAWNQAIVSISNEEECPFYKGMIIEPIIGLVPIGKDPDSNLWEFAHLETGSIPIRDVNRKIELVEDMGLVFVLIPGGSFNMGAIKPSPENPLGSSNVDPEAGGDENPIHTVIIKPFFLSKYEMTQGQWCRFTGSNPSSYLPTSKIGDKQHSFLHPVEQVSWIDSSTILSKMKLRLPSESEWEYAGRAETNTIWWPGNDKERLAGTANLVDSYCKNHGGPPNFPYEEWLDDGYVVHAPVGSFLPNAFGLHDVHGNVWEWCQDILSINYKNTPTDGAANTQALARLTRRYYRASRRVYRGGGWNSSVFECRSAYRSGWPADYRYNALGLRPAFSCP